MAAPREELRQEAAAKASGIGGSKFVSLVW